MIEELYARYHTELVKWCLKMTENQRTAEDIVHDTFLRAIQNEALLTSLNEKQQRAWLYRTTKNAYIDRVRHASYETAFNELSEERRFCEGFSAFEWRELLTSLPDMEGVIFSMRYLEGLSSNRIGEILSLPAGTVRFKLSLARKHLREALKK